MAINRSWLQGTVGLVTTVVVLVICFGIFAVRLATRSHPAPYTEESAPVTDTTRIFRNSFGVPHVVAPTEADMFFAQGYVHAQDRLWQMDVARRVGRGRLAEVVGQEAIDIDVFMRAIDMAGIARQQMKNVSKTTRSILDAYTRGVNAYIRENKDRLAFEFDALAYGPTPWTPEDCLIVGRVLAFELSLAFWTDLSYAQISAQRGRAAVRNYIPIGPGAPYVLDTTGAKGPVPPATDSTTAGATAAMAPIIEGLTRRIDAVRNKLGMKGSSVGSNCWAVRTDSAAILANDPHLSVGLPPKWYQIHLSSPTFNVIGMSVPGMPLVFSGRNDDLAWGFSNVMVDDVDYFLERIDSTNGNYYIASSGRRTKFKYRRDTIHIKDQSDSLIDLRFTTRSAVISDVHLMREPSKLFGMQRQRATTLLTTSCLTYRWTASTPSDEILAMYKINKAKTFPAIVDAVGTWHAPALNISVATGNGLVGTVLAGVIPQRGNADPHLLAPGWDAASDWKGLTHLRTLGTMVNPARGFVSSANNRTWPRAEPFIGTLYEPSSRAERINDQLRLYEDYTVRDAQVMQMDIVSPYAKQTLAMLLPILKRGQSRYGTMEREALKILARWDGTQSPVDPGASIYAALLERLIWNTFEDELGQQLFYDYTFVGSIPLRRMQELLNEPQHVLFDDSRTSQREDLAWIAIRSYIEAVRSMATTFQSEQPQQWLYGTLHTVTFPHRFGNHPLMRPVMNQGPFEIGGSSTTINNTEWRIYAPYDTRVAASMRVISDMHDTVQYSVVPGGVSGEPLNAHYSDQLQLWLKGGYVRLPVAAAPDVSFRLYHVFVPSS